VKTLSDIQANTPTSLSARISCSIPLFLVIPLFLIFCVTHAYAGQVTLGWDQNTEPDLAGYKIYYSNSSGNYTESVNITSGDVTTCTISDLMEGQTYYFAATAYNSSLVESNYSAEVYYTIDTATTTSTVIETTTTTTVKPTTSTTISAGSGGGGGGGGGSTPLNTMPVAEAGNDQEAIEGDLISLDGSESYDNDGDSLTYQWTQISGPTVSLSGSTAAQPEFYAPSAGTFTFTLVVNDGELYSTAETVAVIVYPLNHRPIAQAGNDLNVQIGDKVLLDGRASYDTDGNQLTYNWIQLSGPAVSLTNANSPTPYFMASIEGIYQFDLTVFDGKLWSLADSVVITVKTPVINLISPANGTKIAGSVRLAWDGKGFVNFRVLVSKDGKVFNSLGETTEQYYTISDLTTLMLSTRKAKSVPIYWKIQGKKSMGDNYGVASEIRKFYTAPNLKVYQNALRELLARIQEKKS
jgi:hypothetical protein